MEHKIFIDDMRQPQSKHDDGENWILCESYEDFEKKINELIEKKEWISEISFDYDLRDWNHYGSDCFKLLAQHIDKQDLAIPEKIYVHSEYDGCEKYFKSVAMSLSHYHDKDVDLIKINENGTQTILKTWE